MGVCLVKFNALVGGVNSWWDVISTRGDQLNCIDERGYRASAGTKTHNVSGLVLKGSYDIETAHNSVHSVPKRSGTFDQTRANFVTLTTFDKTMRLMQPRMNITIRFQAQY